MWSPHLKWFFNYVINNLFVRFGSPHSLWTECKCAPHYLNFSGVSAVATPINKQTLCLQCGITLKDSDNCVIGVCARQRVMQIKPYRFYDPRLFHLTIQTDINVLHLRNNAIHCEDVWPASRSASVTWVEPYRFEHKRPLIRGIGSPAPRHSSCYSEPGESRFLNFLHGLVCLCDVGLLFRSSGDVSLIFPTVLKHLSLILMFSYVFFLASVICLIGHIDSVLGAMTLGCPVAMVKT